MRKLFICALAFCAVAFASPMMSLLTGVRASGPPFSNTHSIALNGSSQYVDYGTALNTIFNWQHAYSVVAWVYPTTSGKFALLTNRSAGGIQGVGNIIGFYDQSGFGPLQAIAGTSGLLQNYTNQASPLIIATNAWSHVVFTNDGNNLSTSLQGGPYVNNSFITSTNNFYSANSGGIPPSADLLLGYDTSGSPGSITYFQGDITQVAIYNRVLTSGEITADYNGGTPVDPRTLGSAGALIAWYQFNSDLTDSIGSNNGTGVGSPTFSTNHP